MPIENNNGGIDMNEARETITNRVGELIAEHMEGIGLLLEKSKEKKVRLNFAATVDLNGSQPSIKTTIGFGQMVKDSRDDVLGEPDPDQEKMDFSGGETGPLPEQPGEGPVDAHKRRRKKDPREEQAEQGN